MTRGYPGSAPGIDSRSQGVIPRRFKRKKNFVTNVVGGWTHRREGGNSYIDVIDEKLDFYSFTLNCPLRWHFLAKDPRAPLEL